MIPFMKSAGLRNVDAGTRLKRRFLPTEAWASSVSKKHSYPW